MKAHGIADMNRSSALFSSVLLTAASLLICWTPLLAQESQSTDPAAADTAPAAVVGAPSEDEAAPATAEAPPAPTEAETAVTDAEPATTDAAPTASAAAVAAAGVSAIAMSDVLDMLQRQQAQLDEQKRQLEEQQRLIVVLQGATETELAAEKEIVAAQAVQIEDQRKAMASLQTQIDQINQKAAEDMSAEDIELRSRLETLESSIKESQESSSTVFDEDSFPNSTMIPGTNAAMKMGGFVKMNIVGTFDPLSSLDRFIAGTIPVPQETSTPRTTMTVSQSRLNYDLRDKTKYGTMRAYIEADFAGEGDTFRLRHAFGQFRSVLVGKTWSVFQDTDAIPEEIDFEGINGAVNVRQPQVRYFPHLG
jgi:hypothetical protein